MARIFSYESLFEKWVENNQLKNVVVIGQNLRHDKEGFLYDNPSYLLQLAANQNDMLMFYTILYCYEPSELDDIDNLRLNEKQGKIYELYRDSMLDAVDSELASSVFNYQNQDLWGV